MHSNLGGLRRSAAVLALAVATACSKSGSDSPPEAAPPGALFFQETFSGSFRAVDPRNATTVVLGDPSPVTYFTGLLETGAVSSGRLTGLATRALFWLDRNGAGTLEAFKVDAPVGSPRTRVSSLSLPESQYCSSGLFPDHARPASSAFLILAPGPDGLCDTPDDVLYLLRLSMGPADAPIVAPGTSVPGGLFPVYAPDGAIAQWLMGDQTSTWVASANLSTSQPVGTGTWQMIAQAAGRIWLLDGAGDLKHLAHDGAAFLDPGGVATTFLADYTAADETHLYWSSGSVIRRVRLDGTAAAEVVHTTGTGGTIRALALSSGRVVYDDDATRSFSSVPKAGGAATPLLAPGANVYLQAAGSSLYFSDVDNQKAYAMADDGTGSVEFLSSTAHPMWFFTNAASRPFAAPRGASAGRAFLVDDTGPAGPAEWWLRSFDAGTRTGGLRVATLPAGWVNPWIQAEASGTKLLVAATAPTSGSLDLFLADATVQDSVVQVTSTTNGLWSYQPLGGPSTGAFVPN